MNPRIRVCVVATRMVHVVLSGKRTVSRTTPAGESRTDVKTPATTEGVSLAISPDANKIVFAAVADGKCRFGLLSLATGMSRPLPRTDDVVFRFPCWSLDTRVSRGAGGFGIPSVAQRVPAALRFRPDHND